MPCRNSSFATLVPSLVVALAGTAYAAPPLPFPAVFELTSLNGENGVVLNGIDGDDRSGCTVSAAGDVNGDGIADLIIGAFRAHPNGTVRAGETYVVFGGAGLFPAVLEHSALDGSNGFVVNGIDANDWSGRSVSSAGDVNSDGIDDLIIGAPNARPNGVSGVGESYVIFGKTTGFSASFDLAALNGANGFVINGIDGGDQCGRAVSSAGDVNGDGIDDLFVGAPYADPTGGQRGDAGESYVIFGKIAAFAATFNASSLNSGNGFILAGGFSDDRSGSSVSCAGDFNGDGIDDMIVGAPRINGPAVGETYVVFGTSTGFPGTLNLSTLNGTNGFILRGVSSGDSTGLSVSCAGDVNGDGVADVIIGAHRARANGVFQAGVSYVVFGRNTGFTASMDLSTLDGTNGFAVNGIAYDDRSGYAVSSAGDVNGDGIADLIIGAPNADPNGQASAGKTYVIFGTAAGFTAAINLSTIDGTNGFVIHGIDADDRSGCTVSAAGDVNGDGIDDMIIGAAYADPNGQSGAGESYVIFGRAPVPCDGDIDNDGFTNAADFTILAGNFGSPVAPSSNGDLNGDGLVNAADFVILAGDFGCGN